MSSTNVHSKQKKYNIECVGGQVIANPRENEMVIPPKASGRSPASLDVKLGIGMEIAVGDSELHRDGTWVAKDGAVIAKFNKAAYDRIAAKHARQQAKTKSKTASKGEDR